MEENMFDEYAKTIVSQKPDMIEVQKDIAESLGLTLGENNPHLKAGWLNQSLKGKKVLIILDDVWEEFDLQSLGITLEGGQRRSKIVFTSRTEDLWMKFQNRRELSLKPLPFNESWNLFKENIGVFLDDKPEFVPTAERILEECAGLPLALVTLGRALLGKSKHVWNDTLKKLRTISGVEQKVYESLRLSYDHLDNEEAKALFLLCSLFEEDSRIYVESLVNMGMGLQLFKGISIDKARDIVYSLVEHLQSRCFVSKGEDFITVHDLVRDVLKSIAYPEKGSSDLEHSDTFQTSQGQSFAENCASISVKAKEIIELPSRTKLELLRWRNEDPQIPDSYFKGMGKLQVVDIICSSPQIDISLDAVLKLPSSLQSLTSLHTLCLRYFRLGDFSAIKLLKSLEIVRIADKYIEELPKEIGELTKLRLLDMSDCENLKKVSPGIISRLKNIEELYLGGLDIAWGAEENEEDRSATLCEFKSLSNLRILHIMIKDQRMLPKIPIFKNLKKHRIQVGLMESREFQDSKNYERILSISHVALGEDFKFLLHNSEALLLKGESTDSLLCKLDQEGSQSIKCLEIWETDTPVYLANVMDYTKAPFLVSSLESLRLIRVNNLLEIINVPLVAGNFAKLKKLEVYDCKHLTNIFRLSNVVDVLHLELEELFVYDCESMEEIICWERREEEANRKLQFPKLRDLRIGGKSLVSFCKGANEILFDELEKLSFGSIPAVKCITSISHENPLNSIFPTKVLFPKLVEMNLKFMQNVEEIWCGQPQPGSFLNLGRLIIYKCDSLQYVFSPSMSGYLAHLHTLEIYHCQSLKEIVNGPIVVGSLVKLKELKVIECNQLRNVFQLSTAVDIMHLETLEIECCESMEEVIKWGGGGEDATSKLQFPELQNLRIKDSSLICFCKRAKEIEFHQLESLYLGNIPAVECLIPTSNENILKSIFPHKVSFLHLQEMTLYRLENMKEIWCGELQSGSFKNLSELDIGECDSLEYVFSPRNAKYLEHLRRLKIFACMKLKEVIPAKNEVDGRKEHKSIIFPQLEAVKLYKLRAFRIFSHIANDLEFPVLNYLGIVDCPKFKNFSPGTLQSPKLKEVKLYEEYYWPYRDIIYEPKEEEKECLWKGNLKSTIKYLHEYQQQRRRW